MGYITTLLYSQLFVKLPLPNSDFTGQTVVVTGSNTGLGFDAVRHLVRLNAKKVILAVRNLDKGKAAVQELIASTNCSPDRLEIWPLDLSVFESVISFGERLNTLDRLDAVIQNAGILSYNWDTAEGYEKHITVNVISPILLGLLVLPVLRETAKENGKTGHLSFVGSDMMQIAKFTEKDMDGKILEALNNKDLADMQDRYALSL